MSSFKGHEYLIHDFESEIIEKRESMAVREGKVKTFMELQKDPMPHTKPELRFQNSKVPPPSLNILSVS